MNRRVVILLVVVAVLSVVSSATATRLLVTSKDIKNGTIRPVDLSPAAKRAMRGTQGPPGERGPAGHGSVVTSSNSILLAPHTDGSVTVLCSSGDAVGGGFKSASRDVSVYDSRPISPNGWQVRGENLGATSSLLDVVVVCAETDRSGASGQQR